MFVCVDNKKYNIPNFIDRVPSILKRTGEVYTDDQLHVYIDLKNKNSNVIEEISPMVSMYGSSMYSSSFSSIDGNDAMLENKNYLSLGFDNRMIHVSQDEQVCKKTNNESSKAFERLMESRNLDDTNMKKSLDMKTNGGTIKV
jgi:hypothetical protein